MKRRQSLLGYTTAEVTSAEIPSVLNGLTSEKIDLLDIKHCNDLTVCLTIRRKDRRALSTVAKRYGANVRFIDETGVQLLFSVLLRRPVLLGFLLVVFLLTCFLPSRILFITVDGNTTVPDKYILEAAAECGIGFGTSRSEVRSEAMKNALLERIPQLQWAGINTTGCTAVISVREKTSQQTHHKINNAVCNIVASRDGIIQARTVIQGNPLCSVGQAVKAGQTLISGYTDCGIVTKATQADGEIKALTSRDLQVAALNPTVQKGEYIKSKTVYSLRIGKKLIKFYKGSRNLDTTCGKIYLEKYVRLPGGFQLPIVLIKETVLCYADSQDVQVDAEPEAWLTDFALEHLKGVMISGEILAKETEIFTTENACYLHGRYTCMEMIGQKKYELTLTKDEGND